MDRRDFLKKAGMAGAGSLALASVPGLAPSLLETLSTPALAAAQTNFHFLAFSRGATIDGVEHRVSMSGDGKTNGSQVVAGGSFVHFDNASPVPRTILGTGTWKAKRLLSFDLIGTWGVFAAGILEAEIHLVPAGGSPIPAVLKIVCNIGPAGISTGLDEGFTLTIPDAPFSPFVPLVPALGLTVFTTENERRD